MVTPKPASCLVLSSSKDVPGRANVALPWVILRQAQAEVLAMTTPLVTHLGGYPSVLVISRRPRLTAAMQVREARAEDAEEACAVLRRSIIELCSADHRHDPK